MEETLGKRIAAHRKQLKLTQDQLAEQLGVTAQAVSKWENDLSCPDIGTLPRLASIFGISIDALLGCEPPKQTIVHEGEVVSEKFEKTGGPTLKGQLELQFDNGKKGALGLAFWVLLCGGTILASRLMDSDLRFWDSLWTTGLLTFGLWELFPKFSVFRLGCALFGGYFLLEKMSITSFGLSGKLIFPVCLLLFGLGLLIDALKKPRNSKSKLHSSHHSDAFTSSCNVEDDHFQCDTSFGENTFLITSPRLVTGKIDSSFSELTVDLSGCAEIADNCIIDANCSFGDIKVLVPSCYELKANPSNTFGSFDFQGQPVKNPQGTILLNANVSFGKIQVIYI